MTPITTTVQCAHCWDENKVSTGRDPLCDSHVCPRCNGECATEEPSDDVAEVVLMHEERCVEMMMMRQDRVAMHERALERDRRIEELEAEVAMLRASQSRAA